MSIEFNPFKNLVFEKPKVKGRTNKDTGPKESKSSKAAQDLLGKAASSTINDKENSFTLRKRNVTRGMSQNTTQFPIPIGPTSNNDELPPLDSFDLGEMPALPSLLEEAGTPEAKEKSKESYKSFMAKSQLAPSKSEKAEKCSFDISPRSSKQSKTLRYDSPMRSSQRREVYNFGTPPHSSKSSQEAYSFGTPPHSSKSSQEAYSFGTPPHSSKSSQEAYSFGTPPHSSKSSEEAYSFGTPPHSSKSSEEAYSFGTPPHSSKSSQKAYSFGTPPHSSKASQEAYSFGTPPKTLDLDPSSCRTKRIPPEIRTPISMIDKRETAARNKRGIPPSPYEARFETIKSGAVVDIGGVSYLIGKLLGIGNFKDVFLATTKDGKRVVIKKYWERYSYYKSKKETDKLSACSYKYFKMLSKLDPCVLGVGVAKILNDPTKDLCFVQEYYQTDIDLSNPDQLDQIAKVLAWDILNKQNLDLLPENFKLGPNGRQVYLIDFREEEDNNTTEFYMKKFKKLAKKEGIENFDLDDRVNEQLQRIQKPERGAH